MTLKLKSMDYHRNGCSGLGFHVLIAEERGDGRKRDMLIVRCPKETDKDAGGVACFVFSLAELDKRNVKFGQNSFRGDHYHEFADQEIKKANASYEGAWFYKQIDLSWIKGAA